MDWGMQMINRGADERGSGTIKTRNKEMNFIVVSLNARSGFVADSLAGWIDGLELCTCSAEGHVSLYMCGLSALPCIGEWGIQSQTTALIVRESILTAGTGREPGRNLYI